VGAAQVIWDVEWFDANGTPLEQRQGLERETAEHQAQHWLKAKPRSRVYLYRRHGETSVLMQIFATIAQEHAN
jgi:hypothetical protein